MVRKTREQVWRELDELGEDEVRGRLAGNPDEDNTRLAREWLARKERVASELSATAAGVAPTDVTERGRRRPSLALAGGVALVALSGVALGYFLARRRR